MNYLGEINLFYQWVFLHSDIRPSTIVLWHGLMYLANIEEWKQPMAVAESKLILVTNLTHATLYRERRRLCQMGLLRVTARRGKLPTLYTLISMEAVMLSYQTDTTNEVGEVLSYHGDTTKGTKEGLSYHGDTINDTTRNPLSYQGDTTNPAGDMQEAVSGKKSSRAHARDVSVKKLNKSIHVMKEKETNKKKKIQWRDWLEVNSQEPWKSILRLWLEYKEERGEQYSGAVSLGRLQSHLKNISGDNPAVAQQVVDRSIACNWKGLFPLDRAFTTPATAAAAATTRAPQQGQHIGQIMQPRTAQARTSVLDKFNNKANKNDKKL